MAAAAGAAVWAIALTLSPDTSMHTSDNERFMEIWNSFNSLGEIARCLQQKRTIRYLV
jgi:hypothetical protein